MTYGFARSGNAYTLRLSAEEAQAVGLVVAQVAGLIQGRGRRATGLDLGPSSDSDELDDYEADPTRSAPPGASMSLFETATDLDDFDFSDVEGIEVEVVEGPGIDVMGLAGSSPDPVLARLFPDGYRDNPEAAAELRSLTESSLREQKIGNAAAILDDLPFEGGEIRLDGERVEAWLLALNDARLMLGTALEIEADTDPLAELEAAAGADPTGPRVLGLSIYQFLTGLQASLVEAVDPEE
jgi:hypothetical protein